MTSFPLKSLSSQATSILIEWRNPQGKDVYWIGNNQPIDNYFFHTGRVITAEIGMSVLALSATIETIAYVALTSLSLFVLPFSSRPVVFFASLSSSSHFSIYWNLTNILGLNFFSTNLSSDESTARVSHDHSKFCKLVKIITTIASSVFLFGFLNALFVLSNANTFYKAVIGIYAITMLGSNYTRAIDIPRARAF